MRKIFKFKSPEIVSESQRGFYLNTFAYLYENAAYFYKSNQKSDVDWLVCVEPLETKGNLMKLDKYGKVPKGNLMIEIRSEFIEEIKPEEYPVVLATMVADRMIG